MIRKPSPLGSLWTWLPLLALLPIAFTLLGWRQSARQAEAEIGKELHHNLQNAARTLEDRIQDYEHLLEGARGLLATSENPGGHTWDRYVRQVNSSGRFRGLRVVGYAQRKRQGEQPSQSTDKAQDQDSLEFEVRGDSFTVIASQVHGPGAQDGAPPDPMRQPGSVQADVIGRAIDQGKAISSAPLPLLDEHGEDNGGRMLFMVLPWYGNEGVHTISQRRQKVEGLLFASWQAGPMVIDVANASLRNIPLTIEESGSEGQILYRDPLWDAAMDGSGACMGHFDSVPISINGVTWKITACDVQEASSMPVYLRAHRWLFLGTIASFILLGLCYWVLRQRTEGLRANEHMQRKHMALSHRLRDIATRVPVLIAHLDRKGRFLFANDLYLQWFGVAPSAIEGKKADEAFGGTLGTQIAFNVEKALNGRVVRQETRIEMRTFDVHYTPETDEKGTVVGAYFVASDITRHKQMERHLSEEKERAEVTLAAIGEAVLSFDKHGRVLYSNPAACFLLKAKAENLHGRRGREVLRFLDGNGQPLDEHPMSKLLEYHGELVYRDLLIEDAEGSLVAVEAILSLMKDDDERVIGAVCVLRDVSQARKMSENLRYIAHHDALTGLPNRMAIHRQIDEEIARIGSYGGLVFLDLDHFKNINDTLGHEIGDRVLVEAAARLRNVVGSCGAVARQGGDEFLILLPGADQRTIDRILERALFAIAQPFTTEHRALRITASAGTSTYPDPGSNRVELMRQADAAMYASKRGGRNQVMAFKASMGVWAEERMTIEQGLRNALTNGEFILFYQPKIEASSNTLSGYEALVRWRRGDEILQPGAFIPIAEECGLIGEVDLWVMREACRQQARWMEDGLSPVACSVNVSMAWLDGPALLGCVDEILAETNIPPQLLQIEFTETQVMHDGDQARELVSALRDRGVSVALDDFGTGYSNLVSLGSFGFDTIKIDRSFIQELDDPKRLSLVRAIISIGRAHGHVIVAEGVETASQASILAREGCHQMQGYLYSRPVDPEKIKMWLTRPFHGQAKP